jgi:hypothetical protein
LTADELRRWFVYAIGFNIPLLMMVLVGRRRRRRRRRGETLNFTPGKVNNGLVVIKITPFVRAKTWYEISDGGFCLRQRPRLSTDYVFNNEG